MQASSAGSACREVFAAVHTFHTCKLKQNIFNWPIKKIGNTWLEKHLFRSIATSAKRCGYTGIIWQYPF